MNKEVIKEGQQGILNRKFFKKDFFKIPGSRREQVTEIFVLTNTWLVENGQKIELLTSKRDSNNSVELIDEGTASNFNGQNKLYARKYVADVIIPSYHQGRQEAHGDKGLFKHMILNAIKEQPIVYIGEILADLKGQVFPWCGDLAEDLLKDLEDGIVSSYEKETPVNKEDFKKNIKTKFPSAKILERLK